MKELNTPMLIGEINDKIAETVDIIKKAAQPHNFTGRCWINRPKIIFGEQIEKQIWLENPPAIPAEDILSIDSLALPGEIFKDDKIDAMGIYSALLILAETMMHVRNFRCQWWHEINRKMVLIDETYGKCLFHDKFTPLPVYETLDGKEHPSWESLGKTKIFGWERTCNGNPITEIPMNIDVSCPMSKDVVMKNRDFSKLLRDIKNKIESTNMQTIEYKFYTGRYSSVMEPYPEKI